MDEGISSANMFIDAGMDAIEVSEGVEETPFNHIRPDRMDPYYVDECRKAREAISKPLILVGGMRDLSEMEKVVDDGIADAISMCRPFIMDQHIVKKFREGSADKSLCTSCNSCLPTMLERNLHCTFNSKLINF